MTQLKGTPQGDFARLASLIEQHRSRFWIPYSATHLNDIARGYDPTNPIKVDYTFRDLEYLAQLTQGACLQTYSGQERPTPDRRDPVTFFEEHYAEQQESAFDLTSLYETFDDAGVSGILFRSLLQLPVTPFPAEAPPFFEQLFPGWKAQGTLAAIMQDMGALVKRMNSDYTYSVELRSLIQNGIPSLAPKAVSSAKPAQAFQHIEELLAPFMGGRSLFAMLEEATKEGRPAGKEPTMESRFIDAYYKLELFNFHPENLKPKNHFPNILGDATHAFLAGHCDFLVTNDKNLRPKAEAVYQKIRTSTRIFTVAEFVEFISAELVEYNSDTLLPYLEEALRTAKLVSEVSAEPAGQLLYMLPYYLLDRFNVMESNAMQPTGQAWHFVRYETTYSYFTLCDEIRDLVDTLAQCLGPDDDQKTVMQLPEEIDAVLADAWTGRQWTFANVVFELAYTDVQLQFSVIVPQLSGTSTEAE